MFQNILDGWERTLNARVVGDESVFYRNVEIYAHDNAASLEINITNCFFIHVTTLF